MNKLFERHDEYLSTTPMNYVRRFSEQIDWSLQLVIIKGSKGVGKSTLIQQYIKMHFSPDDRHVLISSSDYLAGEQEMRSEKINYYKRA